MTRLLFEVVGFAPGTFKRVITVPFSNCLIVGMLNCLGWVPADINPMDHSHHHSHPMATPTSGGHDHGGGAGGGTGGHEGHMGMVSFISCLNTIPPANLVRKHAKRFVVQAMTFYFGYYNVELLFSGLVINSPGGQCCLFGCLTRGALSFTLFWSSTQRWSRRASESSCWPSCTKA